MRKKQIFVLFILILLIIASLVASAFLGRLMAVKQVPMEYKKEIGSQFEPFLEEIYLTPAIKGKVLVKGEVWKVDTGSGQFDVLNIPRYEIIKGNEFSGNDYQNWTTGVTEEVAVGDEVTINGYHDSAKNYLVPVVIFVKRDQ